MAVVPQQILDYISRQEEEDELRARLFPEGMPLTRDDITGEGYTAGDIVGGYQDLATGMLPVGAVERFREGDILGGVTESGKYLAEFTPFPALYRTGEALLDRDYGTAALELTGAVPFGGRMFRGAAIRDGDRLSINNEKPVVDGVNVDPSRTQRSNTTATYEKLGNYLQQQGIEGDVLDFGAGFGLGTPNLGVGSKSFEPYPQGDFLPDFDDVSKIPDNSFPSVASVNNLNVIPPEAREQAVRDIGRILQSNGQAVITVRPRADVNNAKNFKPVDEDGAKLVFQGKDKATGEDIYTYQKGYTPKELKEYVSNILGEDNFKVETLTKKDTGISVPQVKITKLSSNTSDVNKVLNDWYEGYIDQAIEELEHGAVYKSRGYIATVNPDEVLKATTSSKKQLDEIVKKAGEFDPKIFNPESKFFIQAVIDENGVGKITGHEGRHRLAAMSAAGIEQVPIQIQRVDGSAGRKYITEAPSSLKLKGQFSDDITINAVDPVVAMSPNLQALKNKNTFNQSEGVLETVDLLEDDLYKRLGLDDF